MADPSEAWPSRIIGYQLDDEGAWVARLECGHTQHVRHRPPWINRPWVTTWEGRRAHLGWHLYCRACPREWRAWAIAERANAAD